ncbi:MAG: 4Fe-4S dicluster domain-containing protein [Bacteroidetes bacterium]|nr:4Fe-4S dicluster domain-containing protein [Bacteroidota bacterium]MCL2302209.1 4Fe-4S dicluster domain-containing protein [Lentimicrobiaceae bacterium]MCL2302289.1 4Fe-4S dicluster domain-containing protein [Lentimicrobiaceae bacterium]
MINFGFQINQGRTINLDIDRVVLKQLEEAVASFRRCIRCGTCTATCSAAQFTDFNIRKIHTTFRSGMYKELADALKPCMLCGKCTLVCPRDVNLRSLVVNMRKILNENDL